jgi:putative zinc finger/helix-turn-helix YgiT family protein
MFCLKCENSELIKKKENFDGEVRGESFKVKTEGMVCPQCGFKTLNPSQMDDFRLQLSEAYRKKHGLLTSKDIVDYRARRDMTQEDFADYLGVGVASLKRWELGKIQDPSSDKLIRLCADPDFAERNAVEVLYGQHVSNNLHGNRSFDLEKFKNVVLKCIKEIQNLSPLFLNKALFYIDFLHYKHFQKSITGCLYACLDYGPCPDQYQSLFKKLLDDGVIQRKGQHGFKTEITTDLSGFSDTEKKVIDYVLGLFKKDRKKYYQMSHEEEGWKKTSYVDLIDYKFASKLLISLPS